LKRGHLMKAMVLSEIAPIEKEPLQIVDLPLPAPSPKQILVKVSACGICHTELDEIEGRLQPNLPIVLGHEIVGRVEGLGGGVTKFALGDRVGIAWIHSACGKCPFCRNGNENLCQEFKGTGCHAHGGYAQYTAVSEDFAYSIPSRFSNSEAAPLLCAGAIGYRDYLEPLPISSSKWRHIGGVKYSSLQEATNTEVWRRNWELHGLEDRRMHLPRNSIVRLISLLSEKRSQLLYDPWKKVGDWSWQ